MGITVGIKIFELIQVLILGSIKFLFAPLLSIGYGFNYFQTVIITAMGGILGLFFFYYLSKWLIKQYNLYGPIIYSYFTGEKIARAKRILRQRKPARKKFTKKNKFIISIRSRYGYLGIILLTPVILSIPIGAFLARKYYSNKTSVLIHMSISVVIWSFFISSLFFLI